MVKNELLKVLIAERDYHATHHVEVSSKFFYTLGAAITTLIAGLIFKDENEILEALVESQLFIWAMALIFVGYCIMIWGIYEHTKIHKLQLDRLEEGIEYLLDPNNEYTFKKFWELFGQTRFSINNSRDKFVKLITKEPDSRESIRFHDRKFEAGIFLILIGVFCLIIILFNY